VIQPTDIIDLHLGHNTLQASDSTLDLSECFQMPISTAVKLNEHQTSCTEFVFTKQKNRNPCHEQTSMHLFMQDITGVVDEVPVANSAFSRAREGRDDRLWIAQSHVVLYSGELLSTHMRSISQASPDLEN
jgi:hypothetical protein